MFVEKITSGQTGLLLYGITPPKSETGSMQVGVIVEKTIERLIPLDLDALIVYDVQDESGRTPVRRPFPFIKAHDPFWFARTYLGDLKVPKIIYRPAGKFSKQELTRWLDGLREYQFYPVFVGVPAPGDPVKTSLPEAYQLWSQHANHSVLGAVTIPERHSVLNDEVKRMTSKMEGGVSYFISQCVFNLQYAKKLAEDLHFGCRQNNIKIPTIIFTLTACGSEKTLRFLEWLGVHIPEALKQEFKNADNMLEKSVQVCLDIAMKLAEVCTSLSIPFGFNIESVAIRKEEIEASVYMLQEIAVMLQDMGIRTLSEAALPAI
ncbi:MAG: methylenetetrahydrofolate reductase [Agriterribacter sp.]